jgi:uncharacterized lipoprotein YmbA
MRRSLIPELLGLFLAGGLSACATSPPTHFYVLTALPAVDSKPSAPRANRPSIGVGPIKLPDYLDRSEIVTRSGRNALKLADFDRWAEPVTDNFMRILAANLGLLVNTSQVSLSPWPSYVTVDYQVVVEVERFDVGPDGKAVLAGRWYVLSGAENKVLRSSSTVITRQVAGNTYADIAAAMSSQVAELAREIAAVLKHLPARPARSETPA